MPSWLWWFLEPFTIERYKLTAFDTIKAMLFVFICLILVFIVYMLIVYLSEKIKRLKRRKTYRKDRNK
jgi:hypothetical protein